MHIVPQSYHSLKREDNTPTHPEKTSYLILIYLAHVITVLFCSIQNIAYYSIRSFIQQAFPECTLRVRYYATVWDVEEDTRLTYSPRGTLVEKTGTMQLD